MKNERLRYVRLFEQKTWRACKGPRVWSFPTRNHDVTSRGVTMCYTRWWFLPRSPGRWSNLTSIFFHKGLVQSPTSTCYRMVVFLACRGMFESILFGEDDFQTWKRTPMLVGTAIMLFAFAFLSLTNWFWIMQNVPKCLSWPQKCWWWWWRRWRWHHKSLGFRILTYRCRFTGHSGKGKMCQCGG